jgi:hypothetical protein
MRELSSVTRRLANTTALSPRLHFSDLANGYDTKFSKVMSAILLPKYPLATQPRQNRRLNAMQEYEKPVLPVHYDALASVTVPLSDVSVFFSPFTDSWLFFAAAICHAGIAALPPPDPHLLLNGVTGRSVVLDVAVVVVPSAAVVAAPVVAGTGLGVDEGIADGALFDAPLMPVKALPYMELVPDEGVALVPSVLGTVAPLIRLPTSVLRPFNSVPSSFNLSSLPFFCASSACGIRSRRPRISSAFRRASSSRFRSASFNDVRTASSSAKEVSRRFVRFSSASFSVLVSVLSWSRSAKAFSKDLSISDLSCSSWGGVGGAISGIT